MKNIKLDVKKYENYILILVILFIIANAFLRQDSYIALISAICGITYTFIAGKGYPICYLFGLTGSSFYCLLALQNALWGNLLLYGLYYIPMQIIGYFKWKKNLKTNSLEIIKTRLSRKEFVSILSILAILTTVTYFILLASNDKHPLLDSITTIFSIGGMYLTVRRAIEQWLLWMIVNFLSLIMWVNVVINGTKAYSTAIMWLVYLFLAIYFYRQWDNDIKNA